MTTPKTTPGEAAYLAFTNHHGREPAWDTMPDVHKRAWEAAAGAAIKHVLGARLADWSSARATEEPPPNTPNGRRVGVSR